MRSTNLIAISFFIITSVAIAQPYTWTPTPGPYGGSTYAMCRANDGSILAGTEGGIFRSTDRGVTWQGVHTGIDFTFPWDMCCDDSGILYAASNFDVLRSTDNGQTWNTFLATKPTSTWGTNNQLFYGIAKRGSTLYVTGYDSGAYRTTNDGQTWTHLVVGLAPNSYLYICAVNDTALLLSSYTSGLYRSTDRGDHWQSADTSFSSIYGYRIVKAPNGDIYACSQDYGPYRSTDMGLTWRAGTGWQYGYAAIGIAISDSIVYAGFQLGVMKSTDRGGTWHVSSIGLPTTFVTAMAVGDSGDVYCGCQRYGMYHSVNHAGNWSIANSGMDGYQPRTLFGAKNGGMWFGTSDGIFTTANNGASWTPTNTGLVGANFPADVQRFTESDTTLYCCMVSSGAHAGAFRWNSSYWQAINTGLPSSPDPTAIVAGADSALYYADYNTGIYRTSTQTINWQNVLTGLPVGMYFSALCAHPNGSVFAVVQDSGAYRTTNHGTSWSLVRNGVLSNWTNDIGVDSAGTLFLGTEIYGVYRSTNNGNQWINSTDGLPDSTTVTRFAFGPNNQVFCIGYLHGEYTAYCSTNGGLLWQSSSEGLPAGAYINTLGVDRAGYLYTAVYGGNVYRSQFSTSVTDKIVWAPMPGSMELLPSYPNPFNSSTIIRYSLPQKSDGVSLKVFDVNGRAVTTLLNQSPQAAGMHTTRWNAEGLASGTYFLRLEAGKEARTERMMLVK